MLNQQKPILYCIYLMAMTIFPFLTTASRRLQLEGGLTEFIVVGVGYRENHRLQRRHDYTPTKIEEVIGSGGAGEFIKVLTDEVIPLVDKTFRTTETERTLLGNSLGGLFSATVMISQPSLFSNYVISSPSTWWDNDFILSMKYLPQPEHISLRVFLSVGGDENPHMIESWARLSGYISEQKITDSVFTVKLAEENHTTAKYRAYIKAVKWLFSGQ